MTILTVWATPEYAVKLAQLSDDLADGSPAEQIVHLASLEAYAGLTCVSSDYTGTVPDEDASLWRWSDGQIVATAMPPQAATLPQVRLMLSRLGLTETQINGFLDAASAL